MPVAPVAGAMMVPLSVGMIACAWGSVVSYPALYWSEKSGMLGDWYEKT